MRFLVTLYRKLDWSYSAVRFDRMYHLDKDPYAVAKSSYERCKQDVLLKFVGRRRHTNALDIGCGTGVLTKRLAPYCHRVLGIDFSSKAIPLAKERCRDDKHISLAVEDIRNFQSRERYDLFVCSEVLYYMQAHDLDGVIDKIAKASAPDAWLVVVDGADDAYTISRLRKRFILMDRVEDSGWDRSFAVSLLGIQSARSLM